MVFCSKIIDMKRMMKLYESLRTPVRVAFFGFVLISIGFLIQNKNVNLFYTFKSSIILFIGELFLKIGEFIIMNLPIIFMLNAVCKKANNAAPVVMALVGYFTFLVTTMLFSTQTLNTQAYATGYGINSAFNLTTGSRAPLETGMIGSLLVAFITRISFVLSRHRGNYSITNLFSKDIAGIVYNFILCFGCGILVSYAYPFLYTYLQKAITFIAADLTDPFRISLYSVLDRLLAILGLDKVIRYPFWFTSVGGSIQNNITGQSVLGDVNIWSYVINNVSDYVGAGRFITPYYVINMFIIPGFYIGTLFSISDKKDRGSLALTFLGAIIISVVAGNPLPVELLMLLTSPALLIAYFALVGGVSYAFIHRGVFLGFETASTNTTIAMPGSFPDFIVNARDVNLSSTLWMIVIVGLIAFVLMMLLTMIYYRVIAFDFASTCKGDTIVLNTIESVGGKENILHAESGLFNLKVYLKNPELISIEKVQEVGPKRVSETRDGINFEFGTSSYAIAKRINKLLK